MKPVARNYAAQVEKTMMDYAAALANAQLTTDAHQVATLSRKIGQSIHFTLPDGGVILDRRLNGIDGEDIRLPYPRITVEYLMPDGFTENVGAVRADKRLSFAEEVLGADISHIIPANVPYSPEDRFIVIFACVRAMPAGLWVPVSTGMIVPCKWSADREKYNTIGSPPSNGDDLLPFVGFPVSLCPSIEEKALKSGASRDDLVDDIASEVRPVLYLCEALSCKNVRHSPIEKVDSTKNARRVKNGKLPIYETRFLWIDVPGKSVSAGNGSVDRNAPRQHLRRGHIRRLADGKRTWVNACVVGSTADGVIEKSYGVKA